MRILGLPVWRESLSDEEYVARVRKGLRVVRWLRWFHAAIGLGVVALSIWGVTVFADILTNGPGHQDPPLILTAFGLAILLGILVGLWLAQAGHAIANAFFGYRRDRLLVQCWDALHTEQKR